MQEYKVMEKMIEYFGKDPRRINHAMKVFSFSLVIGNDLSLDERMMEIVAYTAILHDIGIREAEKKYNSSAGNYQETEGPPVAKVIMSDLNITDDISDRVCFIIGNHHTYNKIDGIDFQVIVEADFLVNIFEDGMKKEAIESIYQNIFKTEPGKRLIKSIYLN
jgi:hypothetical protein